MNVEKEIAQLKIDNKGLTKNINELMDITKRLVTIVEDLTDIVVNKK